MRQMGQLSRPPLKIPHIVSFCCICFFRNHYDFGRKNSEIRDQIEVKTFFFEITNFWESLPRAPNFEYPKKQTTLCK